MAVIKGVVERKVRCHFPTGAKTPGFGGMLFYKADVEALSPAIKEERALVRLHEFAERVEVKAAVVHKWINLGLITPAVSGMVKRFFDRKTVESFVTEYIFSDDAAAMLGVSQTRVANMVQQGKLRAVARTENGCHRYLFRHSDVERIRPDNTVSMNELAAYHKLTRGQIPRRVQSGEFVPVSGPTVNGMDATGSQHRQDLLAQAP